LGASASPEKASWETPWQPYVQRIASGDESALAALYDERAERQLVGHYHEWLPFTDHQQPTRPSAGLIEANPFTLR
jgi:hypothetical protein